ncbi:MAG: hypothetical protein MJ188_10635 [Treponema sp.]|nr:hypothetical protein [Treponema sp.]
MKRRIAFSPTMFYHIIATADVPNFAKPNAVASIFMNSDSAPLPFQRHVVLQGVGATEDAAINNLEHIIEKFLGAHIVSRQNY